MWHFISEHISQQTNNLFICQHRTELNGGDSHKSYVIRDDAKRYFVKTAPLQPSPYLACEADSLDALAKTQTIATPKVVCRGIASCHGEETEYLVLQHLKFIDGSDVSWQQLGESLAKLHRANIKDTMGWRYDNYIGKTKQLNTSCHDWPTFYAENRVAAMLEALAEKGILLGDIDAITTLIKHKLDGHHPSLSLLHGDLWSGNVGFTRSQSYVFDPASYIGDRETDIAMSELFGGFPPAFYQAYKTAFPLSPLYSVRKEVYQLYHVLNHALLFHEPYVSMAKSTIKGLHS